MTALANEAAPSRRPAATDEGSNTLGLAAILAATVALVGVGIVFIARDDDSGDDESSPDSGGGVTVEDAWIDPSAGMTAAYLTIHNAGETDHLEEVTSEMAEGVTLMGGDVDTDGADDVSLEIPSGETTLEPGDAHLMLGDLAAADLQPGEQVPLQLTFERAGTVDVAAQVVTAEATAERSD